MGVCFHSGGFSYNPASGFYLAEFVSGETSIDLGVRFAGPIFAGGNRRLSPPVPQRHCGPAAALMLKRAIPGTDLMCRNSASGR